MGLLLSRFSEFMQKIIDQDANFYFQIMEMSAENLSGLIFTLTGLRINVKLRDVHFYIALLYIALFTKSSIVNPLSSIV